MAVLAVLLWGETVRASAWSPQKGHGEVIVKYEQINADQLMLPGGGRVDLPGGRRDTAASVFVEYGLSDRLTLQAKGEWQDGKDDYVDYRGLGPVELGVRWQAYRDDRNVAALYVGYAKGGAGRNAGYAAPGQGDADVEARILAGRSFGGEGSGGWRAQGGFLDVQAARRWREGLPDETRIDVTAGLHISSRWMVMSQAFGGAAEGDGGAQWLSVENSVVRRMGDWRLQAGWRHTIAGHEIPAGSGLIIGIWRRF